MDGVCPCALVAHGDRRSSPFTLVPAIWLIHKTGLNSFNPIHRTALAWWLKLCFPAGT